MKNDPLAFGIKVFLIGRDFKGTQKNLNQPVAQKTKHTGADNAMDRRQRLMVLLFHHGRE